MMYYFRYMFLPLSMSLLLILAGVRANPQGSPIGMTVIPLKPIEPPRAIRNQIPEDSVVRIFQSINLGGQREAVLVYDLCSVCADFEPHVAIVVAGHVSTIIDLPRLEEMTESYTVITMKQFKLSANQNALALGLRSSGDGAGSFFVVIAKMGTNYRPILTRATSQGRVVIAQGKNTSISVWSAADDDATCVWCKHVYEIETLLFDTDKFRSTGKTRTKSTYEPSRIAMSPISFR